MPLPAYNSGDFEVDLGFHAAALAFALARFSAAKAFFACRKRRFAARAVSCAAFFAAWIPASAKHRIANE